METAGKKKTLHKNGYSNGITKEIDTNVLCWAEHITVIDISNKNLQHIAESTKFPSTLCNLNLSHNKLTEVPDTVLELENLKNLDLSHNSITYFDDTPNFCHTIETLNMSNNSLQGPPYWVWAESPKKLEELNLNYNLYITESLTDIYYKELLKYTVQVTTVKIANCCINKHVELLGTLTGVKCLDVGVSSLSNFCNHLDEIPCLGLDKCCGIERLNLANTLIYTVNGNIDMFKHVIEINLSMNNIRDLPPEFCYLHMLEICVLSCNSLLYLPEDIYKLKKLTCLHIDNNELCMLPERIVELKSLKSVDLYNNCLYEVADEIRNVTELDLAQNFLDEPEDDEYLQKKEKLRINIVDRFDGGKEEPIRHNSFHSHRSDFHDDDEELLNSLEENYSKGGQEYESPSSPEDWDSDDYWVPCFESRNYSTPLSPWMFYVKQKMAEGNFCPMDAHTEPIAELVKYQNKCNLKVWVEVEGQFDDYSDDDS